MRITITIIVFVVSDSTPVEALPCLQKISFPRAYMYADLSPNVVSSVPVLSRCPSFIRVCVCVCLSRIHSFEHRCVRLCNSLCLCDRVHPLSCYGECILRMHQCGLERDPSLPPREEEEKEEEVEEEVIYTHIHATRQAITRHCNSLHIIRSISSCLLAISFAPSTACLKRTAAVGRPVTAKKMSTGVYSGDVDGTTPKIGLR